VPVALDEAVGVQVDGPGGLDLAPVMPDLHGLAGCGGRVIAQRHPLVHQGGIDLVVDDAAEAGSAVFLHLAGSLEQEQIIQIEGGFREAYLIRALRPALQGCLAVESAAGGVMIFSLCVRETYVAATQEKPAGKHMAAGGGHITFVHRTVIALSKNR